MWAPTFNISTYGGIGVVKSLNKGPVCKKDGYKNENIIHLISQSVISPVGILDYFISLFHFSFIFMMKYVPASEIVARWDRSTLFLHHIPRTIGVSWKNAFPTTDTVSTTVSQGEALYFQLGANIKMTLAKKQIGGERFPSVSNQTSFIYLCEQSMSLSLTAD